MSAPRRFRVRQLGQLGPRSGQGNCRKRTLGRLGADRLDACAGDRQPPLWASRASSPELHESFCPARVWSTPLRTTRLAFELTAGPFAPPRKSAAELRWFRRCRGRRSASSRSAAKHLSGLERSSRSHPRGLQPFPAADRSVVIGRRLEARVEAYRSDVPNGRPPPGSGSATVLGSVGLGRVGDDP
jgi:hypothetical protein